MSYDEVGRTRELLLTRIALYGYTMTQVIPTREWSGPAYTYTIGLGSPCCSPQIIVREPSTIVTDQLGGLSATG